MNAFWARKQELLGEECGIHVDIEENKLCIWAEVWRGSTPVGNSSVSVTIKDGDAVGALEEAYFLWKLKKLQNLQM